MRRAGTLLIWLLLPILVIAQSDTPDTDTIHMRFAHFAPDVPAVDVYLNGDLIFEAFDYQQVSVWRLTIPPETIQIVAVPAGDSSQNHLTEPVIYLPEPGAWITVALVGTDASNTLALHPLIESFDDPIAPGETRLTIAHAMHNQPPFVVLSNQAVLIGLLAYPGTPGIDDSTTLDALDIRAGRRVVTFNLTDGRTILETRNLALGENRNYLLAVMGSLSNPTYVLIATDITTLDETANQAPFILPQGPELTPEATPEPEVTAEAMPEVTPESTPETTAETTPEATPETTAETTPEITPEQTPETIAETTPDVPPTVAPTPEPMLPPGQTLIRFAHFAPGTGDLGIYLSGDEIIPTLPFSTLSRYREITGGDYELTLVSSESGTADIVYRRAITLTAGAVMTIAVIGAESNDTFGIESLIENYAPTDTGLARLSIFQAVPDARFVQILADGNQVIVNGLNFPRLFTQTDDGYFSTDILSGTYAIQAIDQDGTLLEATTLRLGEGRHYFLAIVGLKNNAFFVFDARPIADINPAAR